MKNKCLKGSLDYNHLSDFVYIDNWLIAWLVLFHSISTIVDFLMLNYVNNYNFILFINLLVTDKWDYF